MLIIGYIICSLILCGFSIELKEILGTDNYLLVGYRDCEMTIETSLESMLCPYHFSGSNACSSNKGCYLTSAVPFLWTPGHNEVDKEQSPRFFLLYVEQRNLAAKYVSLTVPQFQNGSTRALKRIFMAGAKHTKNEDIRVAKFSNRDFFNFISDKAKYLIGASYDTYTDKFYFHIRGRMNSEIYYFDSAVFRRNVEDSSLWKLETKIISVLNASIFGNGILYVNDNLSPGSYRHFIGPLTRNKTAIMCRSSSEITNEKLFIVKDYDYCRIYSSNNYSKETCDYLISQGKISTGDFGNDNKVGWGRFLTWIIIISVLLNLIFIIIIILRSIGVKKSEPLSQKIKVDKNGKIEYYPTHLSDQSGFSF